MLSFGKSFKDLFKDFYVYVYDPEGMHMYHVCVGVFIGQKKVTDSLELE